MLRTTHPCVCNSCDTVQQVMSTWHSGSTGLEPGVTTGHCPTDKRRAATAETTIEATLNLFTIYIYIYIQYIIYIYIYTYNVYMYISICMYKYICM